MDKEQELAARKKLPNFFVTPSKDATRKDLRTSAAGLVIAANRGMEPKAISSLDEVTLKRKHIMSSQSARAVEKNRGRPRRR